MGEVLAAAAASLPDRPATASDAGGATEWSAGDVAFARLERDGTAEFRLAPAVAAAARRTPDTMDSSRGPDWVRFRPGDLDGHAIDRATAWFGSAWRRATGA
jgi:hypothetical protein